MLKPKSPRFVQNLQVVRPFFYTSLESGRSHARHMWIKHGCLLISNWGNGGRLKYFAKAWLSANSLKPFYNFLLEKKNSLHVDTKEYLILMKEDMKEVIFI